MSQKLDFLIVLLNKLVKNFKFHKRQAALFFLDCSPIAYILHFETLIHPIHPIDPSCLQFETKINSHRFLILFELLLISYLTISNTEMATMCSLSRLLRPSSFQIGANGIRNQKSVRTASTTTTEAGLLICFFNVQNYK